MHTYKNRLFVFQTINAHFSWVTTKIVVISSPISEVGDDRGTYIGTPMSARCSWSQVSAFQRYCRRRSGGGRKTYTCVIAATRTTTTNDKCRHSPAVRGRQIPRPHGGKHWNQNQNQKSEIFIVFLNHTWWSSVTTNNKVYINTT